MADFQADPSLETEGGPGRFDGLKQHKTKIAIGAGIVALAAAAGGAYALKNHLDSKKQQESATRLHIGLVKGTDLTAADSGSTSDPYVTFDCGDIEVKSNIIKKTLNPVWNQEFEVGVIRGKHDIIKLKVFDKDLLSDDSLGDGVFNINDFGPTPKEQIVTLVGGKDAKKNKGRIHLSIWITE
eukprot:TRINITY_DN68_c0_g1_i1.p1 TRINITY_DN68_c0_g1~~TRINITY_DN68_c0_g1_i1.p1  ORF type:complete len:205 (-),score=108.63 TRINITY_DN68_c0_g1_i1:252-800(-)